MAARVKKRSDTSTNRESDKIIVRLPQGMRQHLADVAARSGRSMSAEVVIALAVHFANEGAPLDDRVNNELHRMERAIDRLTQEIAGLRKDRDK
jgi:plasmid stability protein